MKITFRPGNPHHVNPALKYSVPCPFKIRVPVGNRFDILPQFRYLAALHERKEVAMRITNGSKIDVRQYVIHARQTIEVPLGTLETLYLKYEWRSTLCKLGVIECVRQPRRPPNRFWDSGGYAPPPPMSMRRIAP